MWVHLHRALGAADWFSRRGKKAHVSPAHGALVGVSAASLQTARCLLPSHVLGAGSAVMTTPAAWVL